MPKGQQRKVKHIFLDKKKMFYHRHCIDKTNFWLTLNFRVNICEQNAKNRKDKWFLIGCDQSEQNNCNRMLSRKRLSE